MASGSLTLAQSGIESCISAFMVDVMEWLFRSDSERTFFVKETERLRKEQGFGYVKNAI